MRRKLDFVWEELHSTENSQTLRVKVIGGWIVQTTVSDSKRVATSSAFIPDKDHEWVPLFPVKVEVKE